MTTHPIADGVKRVVEISKNVLGFPITVTATPAGSDRNVVILGGCAPHIGSVSLAEYHDGVVTLRTLLRDTHKDQIVGDRFARVLAKRSKCAVCVSCGIHYDNADQQQLQQIVAATEELLAALCERIS